ncbi:MAG: toll/interleukin-1 receptor domain-containing protein [Synergistaceae bacterium]|jgi:hypothetical protein|nr:toll/interleukin-1 receptor domain-containing protein [Synergistaceae bacterium]
MTQNPAPCKIEDGPFIFVSYAHNDEFFVTPVIEAIVSNGYKVWYDKEINVSSIWSDEIANAITACNLFIVFITKASMASQYVRSEVEFALDKKVRLIPVYLEGMDVLPPGLALILHSTQGIEGNNPQLIAFQICKWLARNWGDGKKGGAASSFVQNLREKNNGGKGFWNSGRQKKPEEPVYSTTNLRERVIHQTPVKPGSGVPTASFFLLKWLLRLVLFAGITELVQLYQLSGLQGSFIITAPLWGLSAMVLYWYFDRRFSGPYALFNLLPASRVFQTLIYWGFLLGLLLMILNLNNFKIWALWASQLLVKFRLPYALDPRAIQALDLPLVPDWLKSAAFYAMAASGGVLVLDMVGSFLRRKFL